MRSKKYTIKDVRDELWAWDKRTLSNKDTQNIARSWTKTDQEADSIVKNYLKSSYFDKLKFRWKYLHAIRDPIAKIIFLFFGESRPKKNVRK